MIQSDRHKILRTQQNEKEREREIKGKKKLWKDILEGKAQVKTQWTQSGEPSKQKNLIWRL